jgi:hypothetical protein
MTHASRSDSTPEAGKIYPQQGHDVTRSDGKCIRVLVVGELAYSELVILLSPCTPLPALSYTKTGSNTRALAILTGRRRRR